MADGKNFEVRRYDREYSKDDTIIMREWNDGYTGRWVNARISYVLTFADFPDGIRPGWCIIGLEQIRMGE